MRFSTFAVLLFCLISETAIGQTGWFQSESKKGELTVNWGYNRTAFSKSDISFQGSNYDFKLFGVGAKDRPSKVAADPYLKINAFTIPQYNLRIGYFFHDKWSISFGADHMKYVMPQDQSVKIEGYINEETSIYQGEYNGEEIILSNDFLQFEHTDGLNYLNLEAHYFDNIYRFNEKYSFNYYAGGGAGMLVPKSNVKLMGYDRNDEFHVAGMGLSAKGGINFTFFKYVYIQTDMTLGYINMWDILTRPGNSADRASQDFFYNMWSFSIGGFVPLSKNK